MCTGVDIVEVVHLVRAVAQGAQRAVVAQGAQGASVAQRGIALAVRVETVHLLPAQIKNVAKRVQAISLSFKNDC